MVPSSDCPICGGACVLFDVVDLNKSCAESWGTYLGLSGVPIYYTRCTRCEFCFAPELMQWSPERMKEEIYNDEYPLVDPNYDETRPMDSLRLLLKLFPDLGRDVRHLDFGGGNGLLSKLLGEANWQSMSYDPYLDEPVALETIGTFDLITAFEVFEHVADVPKLISTLRSLLSVDGVLIFSTVLSDGNILPRQRLTWWYASPRNGHISLFSQNSLAYLAKSNGFSYSRFSDSFHVFYTSVPNWARHFIRK
jgi:hypothetical protein